MGSKKTPKKIFIAPCGNERINNHILKLQSIEQSSLPKSIQGIISIDKIADVLNLEEIEALKKIYVNKKVRLWGTRLKNVWESMNINDQIIFYKKYFYVAVAEVVFKTINPALGTRVWGDYNIGRTWGNIFFLNNVHEINIHRKILNKIAGYSEIFRPQGFMRIRNDASQKILKEKILTSVK